MGVVRGGKVKREESMGSSEKGCVSKEEKEGEEE